MIVSLEAIFLSIIVLISQRSPGGAGGGFAAGDGRLLARHFSLRTADEDDLRMLAALGKTGLDVSNDTELQEMLRPTNIEKIQTILEERINVKK
ncbi:MAG: hypothetical protein IPK17_21290 [Chloroflexi bacterium]|nr:hypothetical protein [Chloroflexota bacterium]